MSSGGALEFMQKLISADIPMVQNSQSYNLKKPSAPPTLHPVSWSKSCTGVVSSTPKCLPTTAQEEGDEGRASEIVLDSKMCWVQKMPCIYRAVGVWL